ncbi:MAG: transposase [Gammaproteobacteria bacterium]|nr:transposase [Gammaproteobacteria bacterium]
MRYRRGQVPGATYFFTVALAERKSALLIEQVDRLREAIRVVKFRHPFEIVAMVVMPDHLHAVWRLPSGDTDYPKRWSLIKANFSRGIPKGECVCPSRTAKRERGIWQRRYWEHLIRDERDLQTHVDYIHHNPVKHGYVAQASAWPHSSIHRYIRMGWLKEDWGIGIEAGGGYGE